MSLSRGLATFLLWAMATACNSSNNDSHGNADASAVDGTGGSAGGTDGRLTSDGAGGIDSRPANPPTC